MKTRTISLTCILGLAVTSFALTGCGNDDEAAPATGVETTSATTSATTDAAAESDADALVFEDSWAKATDKPMTGVFGTLRNTTDSDIALVDGSSPAAGLVEMHETVTVDGEKVMRKVEQGLVVPAGGTVTLEPGADHIMLMQMSEPIVVGAEVELTVVDTAGTEYALTAQARESMVDDEPYHSHEGGEGHEGADDAGMGDGHGSMDNDESNE